MMPPALVAARRAPAAISSATGVLIAAGSLLLVSGAPAAAPMPHPAATAAMEKFLARPPAPHGYRATRRLEAAGSGHEGWLDAQTAFSPETGLHYEIIAEGGSGYIRTRVLRSLLEEERQILAQGGGARAALSPDNYEFTCEGIDEEGLAVVALAPRRKDRALVKGRMFLTPDGDLVRLEGRLSRNPSFWVTRADVVRTYRRINTVLVPVTLHTRAHLRLLGASTLRMTYRYSTIDERPVTQEPDAVD